MESLATHFTSLLKMSGQASILIVLVLAAQWICGRRLQPRWRCALWLMVLARLALPWTIASPTSLFNAVKVPSVVVPNAHEAAEAAAQPTAAPVDSVAGEGAGSLSRFSAGRWLVWVWAAGVCVIGVCAVVNDWKIRRRVHQRRPLINETALNLLEDCKALLAVSTPVALIETEAVRSPTLYGCVRPRLLLPAGLASSFTPEELRHVFLHEVAHIKRHDILLGWAMVVMQAVHWFNPLVWLAAHRLRADREMACDALALSYVKSGENESYGLTIVKLLEGFGQQGWAPSLASILENRKQMKERISMIAKFKKTNRGVALAATLVAGLAIVTLTDAQNPTPQQAESGDAKWDLQQQIQQANSGNRWAIYGLWEGYYRGSHGMQPDLIQADKWLKEFIKDVWLVKFEPLEGFAPKTPQEFLQSVNRYASTHSTSTNLGTGSFFRTTRQDNKLVGSFLCNYPDQLKEGLGKVPNLQIVSLERVTPGGFIKYEQSKQESLLDAAKLRERFNNKMAADKAKYTSAQLGEAENLYQIANQKWGTPEAAESLQQMIKKYPDINRTGCAVLYIAQSSTGAERAKYLQDCLSKYNDCFYGDGVQVGAYARYLLVLDYKTSGDDKKAAELASELKTKYPDAVDHSGNLLINTMDLK